MNSFGMHCWHYLADCKANNINADHNSHNSKFLAVEVLII